MIRGAGLLTPAVFGASSLAAFSPLSLENANRTVLWFDPQNAATVWQDDAGTTALTADAQTYGRIDDLGSTAHHFSQETAGSRPAQITYGGVKHIQFDGTDDSLSGGGLTARTPMYMVTAVRCQSSGIGNIPYLSLHAGAGNYVYTGARATDGKAYIGLRGGSPSLAANQPGSGGGEISTSETRVQTSVWKVNSIETFVQRISEASASPTYDDDWRGGFSAGFHGPATPPSPVEVAQAVIVICNGAANDLTPTELANLEEFVRVKGGCPAFA